MNTTRHPLVTKHYVYRMDHDTGFAPHVKNGICTLCGCKKTSVERWAEPGSWVVGIGGRRTGQPDALIYAMEVEAAPTVAALRRHTPRLAAYLRGRRLKPSARVLLARRFYYFGGNAIPLPPGLEHLLVQRQGCKRVPEEDVALLSAYLAERFAPGVHGIPNNPRLRATRECGCGRANERLERTGEKSTRWSRGPAAAGRSVANR